MVCGGGVYCALSQVWLLTGSLVSVADWKLDDCSCRPAVTK